MKTLNIMGCGRVGRTLARLWQLNGTYLVQDVLTTSAHSAAQAVGFIGAGQAVSALEEMRAADVWMLAVPDGQIALAAAALAAVAKDMPPATAFHCSGALTSDALGVLRSLGWQVASAHCILSFASPAIALAQFAGTPCGLEGDERATRVLRPAFSAIGAECFSVAGEDKMLYHAAAVFATNFLPVLHVLASEMWRDAGVPASLIPRLSASLLRHGADSMAALGPVAALTGPAARGDTGVVEVQARAVGQWDETAGDAYRALSRLAQRIAREGGLQRGPSSNRA